MFFIVRLRRRQLAAALFALSACLLVLAATQFPSMQAAAGVRPLSRADSPDDRVALTFDVTWGDTELKKMLASLDSEGVKATFFVGGSWVQNYPQGLQALERAGHEVGTLGQRIVDLTQLPAGQVSRQLLGAQDTAQQVLGHRVRLFRPPLAGRHNEAVLAAARGAGLVTVTYSLDSGDWRDTPAAKLVRGVVRGAKRGDIVLLTASDFNRQTAVALPEVIKGLKARGFKLVTVSQLLPEGS